MNLHKYFTIIILLFFSLILKGQEIVSVDSDSLDQNFSVSETLIQSDTIVETSRSAITYNSEYRFSPKQLVAPVLLIGVGAWGLADKGPIQWLEDKGFEDLNPNCHTTKVDEYIQYVPTATHLLLGFIPGTHPRHNFRDRFLASVTANIFMATLTNSVKYTVRERRPDSSKENSFFSGHTATAFTGAELMRIEYGWKYGAAAYAVAATTGFLRVYNKRHWVGDVLAGAGVGILCADAGYWMLPVWKRLFKINQRDEARRRKKESVNMVVAAPFYSPEDHASGLSCSILLQ